MFSEALPYGFFLLSLQNWAWDARCGLVSSEKGWINSQWLLWNNHLNIAQNDFFFLLQNTTFDSSWVWDLKYLWDLSCWTVAQPQIFSTLYLHFSYSVLEFILPYKRHSKNKHSVCVVPRASLDCKAETQRSLQGNSPQLSQMPGFHMNDCKSSFKNINLFDYFISQDHTDFRACSSSACQPFHPDVIHVEYKYTIYSACLQISINTFIDRHT